MLDNEDVVRTGTPSQEVGTLIGTSRVKEGFHHGRNKIEVHVKDN